MKHHFILDALLTANQVSGQPNPLNIGVTGLSLSILSGTTLAQGDLTDVLRAGQNTIAFEAMDGFGMATGAGGTICSDGGTPTAVQSGNFCLGNNVFEYGYVAGSITTVPEPGTLALFGTTLVGLVMLKRRRRSA